MKIATIVLLVVVGLLVVGLTAQRLSDGPRGPLKGGPLQTGELVTDAEIDWSSVLGEQAVASIELQLVDPAGSRITGAFVHDGALYVPCDLGFIWRRVPDDSSRRLLHLIWLLKDWHVDAEKDGRVVIRAGGKRYERQAVRVTDPALLTQLRAQVETAAEAFFGSLLPEPPLVDAIWFFRLDPRGPK